MNPPFDESDHSPIQFLLSVKANPTDPGPVAEYSRVIKPPTSMPKSNTNPEPFVDSGEFPGNLEIKSPDFERIDTGDTVLEAGAKIFTSHGPGNAVSVGPLHVVFFQHFWPATELIRTKKAPSRNMTFKTAILGC